MSKRRALQIKKGNSSSVFQVMVFFIIFLLVGTYVVPVTTSGLPNFPEGQFLYSPSFTTTTYLRHADGSLNHSWASSFFPGVSVWWPGDGTIVRTIRVGAGPGAGGAGGGVQIQDWDGTVLWDFRYNTNGKLTHHDVKTLPNGNILLIAWETKTRAECIAAGRNPNYISSLGLMPDHIIEVEPTGPSSGDIVWEWHAWDHLVQDYDPAKENYGVVGDHPELIDFNYVTSNHQDLMHTNSIAYNEQFDQILISVHNYNEIWIIDHSTTTEEAAGHTGGTYGMGGDLLYRWGNPMTYDAGSISNRKFYGQHDATWIPDGYPGEGDILVFNNGIGRPSGKYSTVDEIIPPVDENGEYFLESGSAYGPEEQTWIYTANPPTMLYSNTQSGAQRLPSGNTLICEGDSGKILEVTPECTTVWQYNIGSQTFKVQYIPPPGEEPPENQTIPDLDCTGSLSWTNVEPGATVTGSFQVKNIGTTGSLLNWTINTSSIPWGTWSFTPESGAGLTPAEGWINVDVSVIAPDEPNSEFEAYLIVENINNASDFDKIPVTLVTPVKIISPWLLYLRELFSEFLQNHPLIGLLWNILT